MRLSKGRWYQEASFEFRVSSFEVVGSDRLRLPTCTSILKAASSINHLRSCGCGGRSLVNYLIPPYVRHFHSIAHRGSDPGVLGKRHFERGLASPEFDGERAEFGHQSALQRADRRHPVAPAPGGTRRHDFNAHHFGPSHSRYLAEPGEGTEARRLQAAVERARLGWSHEQGRNSLHGKLRRDAAQAG